MTHNNAAVSEAAEFGAENRVRVFGAAAAGGVALRARPLALADTWGGDGQGEGQALV